MKKILFSIGTAALLLSGIFASGGDPQDTARKNRKQQPVRRTDTASDTRLRRNNLPPGTRNDSIPIPTPLPDTIPVPLR